MTIEMMLAPAAFGALVLMWVILPSRLCRKDEGCEFDEEAE